MSNLQENIVPSQNQNAFRVFRQDNNGIRILFVGNSVTRHGPKPSIEWYRDCGMAASDIEHDYVHILMRKIHEIHPNAGYCIAQVAEVEQQYDNPAVLANYEEAAEFGADIVVLFFGANVPKKKCDLYSEQVSVFENTYRKMRNLFCKDGAAVFHVEGFYIRPVLDEVKRKISKEYGDVFVELGEIRTREETHGLYNHPNDKGMEAIADCIWKEMEPYINKFDNISKEWKE